MAKKDAAYEAFLADLEAINPNFKDLLADEKVNAKLRESVLARADYSSKMDALAAERERFTAEVQTAKQNIDGWQSWYQEATTQTANMQTKLQQYEQLYGAIDSSADRKAAAAQLGISKDEVTSLLESRMDQRDVAALKFADDLTDIKIDFKDRFKEKLNTEAVFKLAGEKGVDLTTAYNYHIADRLEEARNKDIEERIKVAKQEAVTEYASKHNLPVGPSTSDMVHTLDAKDTPHTSRDRIAAAVAAVNAMRQR